MHLGKAVLDVTKDGFQLLRVIVQVGGGSLIHACNTPHQR